MENKKELRNWLDAYKLDHPLVIAGPCSAETEDQVLKIAHQLKDTDATVLRAGIWKPRTRPGNFEGVGAPGLKWLQRAKEETGMLTATEVASPYHAELAIEAGIDILWIGARSTVSPFIIQDIAEACKGIDNPILVKNPINPDLSLWLGAVERFHTCNVKNLGVIHRGFSTYEKTKYRNIPEWQIPIDLQAKYPDLPIILDPSHIAGRRDIIQDLCQTGLDLSFDGMIVETHYDPDNAWSDAKQQITPETLIQIMKDLKVRKEKGGSEAYEHALNELRSKIDITDELIIQQLSKRMGIADEIGKVKAANNVQILQNDRWNAIKNKMITEGGTLGLSQEFVDKVYSAIHDESINHQHNIGK